jgi:hypothetical protein
MRRTLEAAQQDASEARAAGERAFRDERDQLQKTIATIRARLEAPDVS